MSYKHLLKAIVPVTCCIFLYACSGEETLPESLPETQVTTYATETTAATEVTTVATEETTVATTVTTLPEVPPPGEDVGQVGDYDFSWRRQLLSSVDVWSEDFRARPLGEKVDVLKKVFPDGLYWNNKDSGSVNPGDPAYMRISALPCRHKVYGTPNCNTYAGALSKAFNFGKSNIQCLGFANMLSDILWGKDAEVTELRNYSELRAGDAVRLQKWSHSVMVLTVSADSFTVAECNGDYQTCKIIWGKTYSKNSFNTNSSRIFRRTPAEPEVTTHAQTTPPETMPPITEATYLTDEMCLTEETYLTEETPVTLSETEETETLEPITEHTEN